MLIFVCRTFQKLSKTWSYYSFFSVLFSIRFFSNTQSNNPKGSLFVTLLIQWWPTTTHPFLDDYDYIIAAKELRWPCFKIGSWKVQNYGYKIILRKTCSLLEYWGINLNTERQFVSTNRPFVTWTQWSIFSTFVSWFMSHFGPFLSHFRTIFYALSYFANMSRKDHCAEEQGLLICNMSLIHISSWLAWHAYAF